METITRINLRFERLFTALEAEKAAIFKNKNPLRFVPDGYPYPIEISPNGLIVKVGKGEHTFGSITDLEIFLLSISGSPVWNSVLSNWEHEKI